MVFLRHLFNGNSVPSFVSSSVLKPEVWVQKLELWQPFWTIRYLWEWKSQARKVE